LRLMIKKTVEISREPAHLATRDEQLLILRKSPDEVRRRIPARPANLAGSIPCEDIGVVMVDSRDTTYSHAALIKLAEYGAAVVLCGHDHHPTGMYLPLSSNTHLLSRLDTQLNASKPLRKRLWAEIVAAKVRAQAEVLPEDQASSRRELLARQRTIRSGDPENVEAQAAAIYWPRLFSDCAGVKHPFRRRAADPDAEPPNGLLDYGYAVVRAAVARSLVSAGLLPAIGVKHQGRGNPFCLADDLMEPLRPIVDERVRSLALQGHLTVEPDTKRTLLEVLTTTVSTGTQSGPLLVGVTRYVASVLQYLAGETRDILFPVPVRIRGKATPRRWAARRTRRADLSQP
jgi:CRISP-associated protein Cas1